MYFVYMAENVPIIHEITDIARLARMQLNNAMKLEDNETR